MLAMFGWGKKQSSSGLLLERVSNLRIDGCATQLATLTKEMQGTSIANEALCYQNRLILLFGFLKALEQQDANLAVMVRNTVFSDNKISIPPNFESQYSNIITQKVGLFVVSNPQSLPVSVPSSAPMAVASSNPSPSQPIAIPRSPISRKPMVVEVEAEEGIAGKGVEAMEKMAPPFVPPHLVVSKEDERELAGSAPGAHEYRRSGGSKLLQ